MTQRDVLWLILALLLGMVCYSMSLDLARERSRSAPVPVAVECYCSWQVSAPHASVIQVRPDPERRR